MAETNSPYLLRYNGSYPSTLCNLYCIEKLGGKILESVVMILKFPVFFCRNSIILVFGNRYSFGVNVVNFPKNLKRSTIVKTTKPKTIMFRKLLFLKNIENATNTTEAIKIPKGKTIFLLATAKFWDSVTKTPEFIRKNIKINKDPIRINGYNALLLFSLIR